VVAVLAALLLLCFAYEADAQANLGAIAPATIIVGGPDQSVVTMTRIFNGLSISGGALGGRLNLVLQ
jgi:hypothetical protein